MWMHRFSDSSLSKFTRVVQLNLQSKCKATFLKLQKLCGFVRIYFDQQVGKTVALILWRGQSPLDRDPAESCVIGAELCSGLFCMQPLLSPAAPAAKANFTTSNCHGTELSVLGYK